MRPISNLTRGDYTAPVFCPRSGNAWRCKMILHWSRSIQKIRGTILEALAVIWSPVSTLSRVAEERRVLLGFGIVAVYAALSLVGSVLAVFFFFPQMLSGFEAAGLPPGFEDLVPFIEVFSLIYAVASPFVLWLLVAGLMQLITRFFGGTGPFSGMLAVVGVAQVPLVIAAVIGIPIAGLQVVLLPEGLTLGDPATISPAANTIGWLNSLLGLAFWLWHAALVVIGAAFARRISYGESVGSCAISCGGCLGLILIVGVVFGVLIGVLVGAAGSTGPS